MSQFKQICATWGKKALRQGHASIASSVAFMLLFSQPALWKGLRGSHPHIIVQSLLACMGAPTAVAPAGHL